MLSICWLPEAVLMLNFAQVRTVATLLMMAFRRSTFHIAGAELLHVALKICLKLLLWNRASALWIIHPSQTSAAVASTSIFSPPARGITSMLVCLGAAAW